MARKKTVTQRNHHNNQGTSKTQHNHDGEMSVGYENHIRNIALDLGLDWDKFVNLPGTRMYTAVVDISPELAEAFLDKNVNNRRKKERSIESYASDMINGFWRVTHEGIAIGVDGLLKDGQNRLYAVIRAGVTVPIKVTLGVENESQAVIDQGVKRTSLDAAKFDGINTTFRRNATAKFVAIGLTQRTVSISNSQCMSLLEKYKDGLDFVFDNMRSIPAITKSPVLAAIVRAYYHYQHKPEALDRLLHFCHILGDGQYGIQDNIAAHSLRERLLGSGGRKAPQHGHQGSMESYALTESAILAFMERRGSTKCYATKQELFPFPHEVSLMGAARKTKK